MIAFAQFRSAFVRSRVAGSVIALLVTGLTLRPAVAADHWVAESPLEFVVEGDFDGDGRGDVLILDRESGAIRVAFQADAGALNWAPAFASGIPDARSITPGRFASVSWDSVAVTGPGGNRIHRLEPRDAATANGVLPIVIYPPGIGPTLVTAIDVGGLGNTALDDFLVFTGENPGIRRAVLRNQGAATSPLDDTAVAQSVDVARRFEIKSGRSRVLGAMARLAGFGSDTFQILDLDSGAVVNRLSFPVPMRNRSEPTTFVAHRFGPSNALAQVLFYRPGEAGFLRYQVQEVFGNFQLAGSNFFALPGGLQRLQPLPAGGSVPARLLAAFGPTAAILTNVTVYEFDGARALSPVASWPGAYAGAISLGAGNLTLLEADPGGRSVAFAVQLADGTGYVPGPRGDLPRVTRFSGSANVLLFDAEPFVNPGARPRHLRQHADWSTALTLSPAVRVSALQYLNASNGLGSASTRNFGPPPSGVTTGLVNQYTPGISVFSGRPASGPVDGEVRITPGGGRFGDAQIITLSVAAGGTWDIRYRTAPAQNWLSYVGPFALFTNATVEFYARRGNDGALTPIGRATFTFNSGPADGPLDSDRDGVPDFVEQQRGLDPRGGSDSDGDGFTDLEELARGTDPRSSGSHPPDVASLGAAFTRLVSPRPPHPVTGADTRPRSGVSVRVFTVSQSFLGEATTSPAHGTGLTNPAARLSDLWAGAGVPLLIETTPLHFDIVAAPDSRTGRELIGLFLPPLSGGLIVGYAPGAGSSAVETARWIAAASNAVAAARNPVLAGLLTVENALVAALFERHVAASLLQRGLESARHVTLFPFRPGDVAREIVGAGELGRLEQAAGPGAPGYRWSAVLNYLESQVRRGAASATLRDFARELWRISAAHHNSNEGRFPLPFDELRGLLDGEALTGSYAGFPTLSVNRATARAEAGMLLDSIPARPETNAALVVASVLPGAVPVLQHASSGLPVTLWRRGGAPCAFPPNLEFVPGTRLRVFGHTDVDAPAGTLAIEVVSLALDAVPMPSPSDAGGNLLADSWEELFLGGTGADPFGDRDGDGYSNLQEMIGASAPDDALQVPPSPALALAAPALELIVDRDPWQFAFTWPSAWLGRFQFGLDASDEVNGLYLPAPGAVLVSLGADRHAVQLDRGPGPKRFYRLTVKLNAAP